MAGKDAYDEASKAVANNTANAVQTRMNAKEAKQAGPRGRAALAAQDAGRKK